MPLGLVYVVSRFPKTTETFVANEILALRELGHDVTICSLIRERDQVVHPRVSGLLGDVRYGSDGKAGHLCRYVGWLARRPRQMASLTLGTLWANRSHPLEAIKSLWMVVVAASWTRQMRDVRIDHVHAHWATYPALGALVMHRLGGHRYSFTAHAHDIQLPNPQLCAKAGSAAAVVTISEFNRHLIARLCPALPHDRIHVVHCGVDPSRFPAGPASDAHPPIVVCVGALVAYKGQRHLVEAARILAARGVAARFRLIGDGPDRAWLEQACADVPSIELVGRLPADRVADELRAATMMVLPSVALPTGQTEGIPVALMEAMAMCRPVVSSRLSGIPELIVHDRTGLLCAPGDAGELAAAVAALIEDPARARKLAEAGRDHVEAHFDEQCEVLKLVELFTALCDRPRPSRQRH
jgi:colanic acid/amylovoran biosynthesis glycosyltransferase